MAHKILGQSAPLATTETDLYTVPAGKEAVISSVTICHRDSSTASTFRLSVSQGGGATANKDYIYYDLLAAPNDTFAFTGGMTLAAGDVMRVYAETNMFSFNLFGLEKDA